MMETTITIPSPSAFLSSPVIPSAKPPQQATAKRKPASTKPAASTSKKQAGVAKPKQSKSRNGMFINADVLLSWPSQDLLGNDR